jgi:hypothetical protein
MNTYGTAELYLHTFFILYYMEVSGQLHASAALPLGKKPPVTIGWNAGMSSRVCLEGVKKRNYSFPPPAWYLTPIFRPVA